MVIHFVSEAKFSDEKVLAVQSLLHAVNFPPV